MSRIVIAEFMDEAAVARLRRVHDVLDAPTLVDEPARLRAEAAACDALIVRNRTQVRGALLDALGRCRVVGRLGVGLDNIDLSGCAARGIEVIPATGANAQSVAEYVIAAALLLRRGCFADAGAVAAGRWPRERASRGHELAGATLGIVGFGSIGRRTAQLAKALGLRVVAHGGRGHDEAGVPALGLDELLAEADVVSLHLPLVEATRGLFDAARLARLKPGAVLVNTARGGIVDELALAEALRTGRLGGAALDVFAQEPLPAAPHWHGCPNLLLTPHVAGVTVESNARVSELIAERVLAALG